MPRPDESAVHYLSHGARDLSAFHGMAEGGTVSILGQGPSLRETSRERVRDLSEVVIGVNRTWEWMPLDVWLVFDAPPWFAAQEAVQLHLDLPRSRALWESTRWVFHTPALANGSFVRRPEVWGGRPLHYRTSWRPAIPAGRPFWALDRTCQADRRQKILPGMATLEYATRGTFPGQQLGAAVQPSPIRLWSTTSSIIGALHLALIMQPSRIVLWGVDLCFPAGPSAGGQRFFDAGREDGEWTGHRGQFDRNRKLLVEFWEDWNGRVELRNASARSTLPRWRKLDPQPS